MTQTTEGWPKNGMTKLTEEDVRIIRSAQNIVSHSEIAEAYGISKETVGRIIRRLSWRNVKDSTDE